MKEVTDFLKGLHENNDRDWFNAHKGEYKLALACFNGAVEKIIAGIRSFDDSIGAPAVKD